jgi:hypothetical protein
MSTPGREVNTSLVYVVFVVAKVKLIEVYRLLFRVFPAALRVLLTVCVLGV